MIMRDCSRSDKITALTQLLMSEWVFKYQLSFWEDDEYDFELEDEKPHCIDLVLNVIGFRPHNLQKEGNYFNREELYKMFNQIEIRDLEKDIKVKERPFRELLEKYYEIADKEK